MRKVFHIISHFDVGGAERVALNIAKSDSPEFEYHVVELLRSRSQFSHVFIDELRQNGVQYHRGYIPDIHFHYLFERLAALTFPLWFIFLFLRYRPQVIHAHTEMPELALRCFGWMYPKLLKNVKVVRTIHNTQLWTGMRRTGEWVERWMQRKKANIAISSAVLAQYETIYHASAPIIFNGVAPVGQTPYKDIMKGRKNILFAGRFEEQKGIDILVSVIQAMRFDERFYFHIIGSGRLQGVIDKELSGLLNVSVRPPVYGLTSYLSSFDALLMPSRHEGFGLLSVEASLANIPVISSGCPGLNETLPVDYPLTAKDQKVESYVALVEKLMDSDFVSQTKQSALDYVSVHFGIRKMQQEYETFYSQK